VLNDAIAAVAIAEGGEEEEEEEEEAEVLLLSKTRNAPQPPRKRLTRNTLARVELRVILLNDKFVY